VPAAAQLEDEGYLGGVDRLGVEVQLHGVATREWPALASPRLFLLPPPYSSLLLLYCVVEAADLGEFFPKGGETERGGWGFDL
jgi:hypothetical protein